MENIIEENTVDLFKTSEEVSICLRNFNVQDSVRVSVIPRIPWVSLAHIREALSLEKRQELDALIPRTHEEVKECMDKLITKVDKEVWKSLAVILDRDVRVHFLDKSDVVEKWEAKYKVSPEGKITHVYNPPKPGLSWDETWNTHPINPTRLQKLYFTIQAWWERLWL